MAKEVSKPAATDAKLPLAMLGGSCGGGTAVCMNGCCSQQGFCGECVCVCVCERECVIERFFFYVCHCCCLPRLAFYFPPTDFVLLLLPPSISPLFPPPRKHHHRRHHHRQASPPAIAALCAKTSTRRLTLSAAARPAWRSQSQRRSPSSAPGASAARTSRSASAGAVTN